MRNTLQWLAMHLILFSLTFFLPWLRPTTFEFRLSTCPMNQVASSYKNFRCFAASLERSGSLLWFFHVYGLLGEHHCWAGFVYRTFYLSIVTIDSVFIGIREIVVPFCACILIRGRLQVSFCRGQRYCSHKPTGQNAIVSSDISGPYNLTRFHSLLCVEYFTMFLFFTSIRLHWSCFRHLFYLGLFPCFSFAQANSSGLC